MTPTACTYLVMENKKQRVNIFSGWYGEKPVMADMKHYQIMWFSSPAMAKTTANELNRRLQESNYVAYQKTVNDANEIILIPVTEEMIEESKKRTEGMMSVE